MRKKIEEIRQIMQERVSRVIGSSVFYTVEGHPSFPKHTEAAMRKQHRGFKPHPTPHIKQDFPSLVQHCGDRPFEKAVELAIDHFIKDRVANELPPLPPIVTNVPAASSAAS